MRNKLQGLLAEYGKIALATYLFIFAGVLGSFAVAISFGFDVEGTAQTAGTLGAAYLATKVTQPLRIAATLVLTPLIARLLRRPPSAEAAPVDPQ